MTREKFDSFVRTFGTEEAPRDGAILRAWQLLFDPSTGTLLPYFWGTVDRQSLQRVVQARPPESLPFALRYSARAVGFAIAQGSPGTADGLILMSSDRSRLQLLGLTEWVGSIGAALAANPSGFATPVESELAERSADAMVAEPHWSVNSPPLQSLLHKLAAEVPPGSGYGACLLRGARTAAGSAARRAEGARALDLARAGLRESPAALVSGACRFAAAAGAAVALGDWYSFLLGLVNAAVCLTAEHRRASGLPPLVARGATAPPAAAIAAAAAAPAHALYSRTEVLASDAATLLTSVTMYAGQVSETAERLYVQCGACDALYALYRGRADLISAAGGGGGAGGVAEHGEEDFGAHAAAVAAFHVELLAQARRAGVPVTAAELAVVTERTRPVV